MIVSISKSMMQRSFRRTRYRFTEIPKGAFDGDFGIYIHVPFCLSKCSFCPFYKEIFSEELKRRYLDTILKEVDEADIKGEAKWIYFGGGTPNTLAIRDIDDIVERIGGKIQIRSMGVELLPALLSAEYLKQLKTIGFTKISIGVESFSEKAIHKTGRKITTYDHVRRLVDSARSLGLWVNADMMVGLPNQDADAFRNDIKAISTVLPDQITIYPFLVIRGLKAVPGIPSIEQFRLIEEADRVVGERGYSRKGVWTFALGDDIYDSSRDELVEDYAGFGPAAFSTYGNWKVVNPELAVYVRNVGDGKRMGFVATNTKVTDEWRRFARMIYDLQVDEDCDLPSYISIVIWILRRTGYIKGRMVTGRGRIFAHEITKTVVESLPFPVQNPNCVDNYDEYLRYKKGE
jgi:coproporphyrinogen III oxidase-like Fe-S oxidoreductase